MIIIIDIEGVWLGDEVDYTRRSNLVWEWCMFWLFALETLKKTGPKFEGLVREFSIC